MPYPFKGLPDMTPPATDAQQPTQRESSTLPLTRLRTYLQARQLHPMADLGPAVHSVVMSGDGSGLDSVPLLLADLQKVIGALPLGADLALLGQLAAIGTEVLGAERCWPPMNSAHECYGVLMEEVRELEACVFTKQGARDMEEMRKEAVQVAAMALRMVRDVIDGGRVRR